jgi:flagellar biosynthetic protein FliR
MVMPGISGPRIPKNVRLFIAFAITLGLSPLLSVEVDQNMSDAPPVVLLKILLSETLIGGLIGFLGRIFFGALETLGGGIAMAIGLSSPIAAPVDESEPLPAVTSLITIAATMLFFLTGLYWEVLRGLVASYTALPVAGLFNAQMGLVQVSDCLSKAFSLALQISSPFIVYALIVNLAIGLPRN